MRYLIKAQETVEKRPGNVHQVWTEVQPALQRWAEDGASKPNTPRPEEESSEESSDDEEARQELTPAPSVPGIIQPVPKPPPKKNVSFAAAISNPPGAFPEDEKTEGLTSLDGDPGAERAAPTARLSEEDISYREEESPDPENYDQARADPSAIFGTGTFETRAQVTTDAQVRAAARRQLSQ